MGQLVKTTNDKTGQLQLMNALLKIYLREIQGREIILSHFLKIFFIFIKDQKGAKLKMAAQEEPEVTTSHRHNYVPNYECMYNSVCMYNYVCMYY